MIHHRITILCLILSISFSANSQKDSIRYKLIKELTQRIRQNYVSKEIALKVCDTINYKINNNLYDTSLYMEEFLYDLTDDAIRVSNDKHFNIMSYQRDEDKATTKKKRYGMPKRKFFLTSWKKYDKRNRRNWGKPFRKFAKKYRRRTRGDMFTYGDIKILPGNVGYVEIKRFTTKSYYRKENKGRIKISTVMRFLSKNESIIIDLRDNMGGSVDEGGRFCSYFASQSKTYLLSGKIFFRYDSTRDIEKELTRDKTFYTNKKITNKLTKGKAIYILTSRQTFSMGEEVAYLIKKLVPGATIIGENTSGSGNGYAGVEIGTHFIAIVPNALITDKENPSYAVSTEGVAPDILVPSDSAFNVAYEKAKPGWQTLADKKTKYLRKEENIYQESNASFKRRYCEYIGNYRKAVVYIKIDRLCLLFGQILFPLKQTAVNLFTAEGFEKIRFIRKNNHVTEIQLTYEGGRIEKFRKT